MFDGGRKARLDAPARLFLLMLVPAVALRLPQPMAVRHVRLFFCSALDGGAGPKPKALPPALALAEWAPHVRDMLRPLGDASCVPREVRHMLDAVQAPVQAIQDPVLEGLGVKLSLKRDDLIHPEISGNKWRKLKYNVLFAATRGESLLTFGGAFSNHIAATAALGAACGVSTVGVIRGEELRSAPRNPTLQAAEAHGMRLLFVSREEFRALTASAASTAAMHPDTPRPPPLTALTALIGGGGGCHIIPEGGANVLGVCGCCETLLEDAGLHEGWARASGHNQIVAVAAGTGATMAGLAAGAREGQSVLGFPVLKGGAFVRDHAEGLLLEAAGRVPGAQSDVSGAGGVLRVCADAHFGGYGKTPAEVIAFVRRFHATTGVRLDPIYTGKMMCALYEMAERGVLQEHARGCLGGGGEGDGVCVLAVHTGGLQGVAGVEQRLGERLFPA